MVWGWMKAILRRNCMFSFEDLSLAVPHYLTRINSSNVRKFANHCYYRYMDLYRKGATRTALVAQKKYSSHRRVLTGLMNALLPMSLLIYIQHSSMYFTFPLRFSSLSFSHFSSKSRWTHTNSLRDSALFSHRAPNY
jgi:hypothetical protein